MAEKSGSVDFMNWQLRENAVDASTSKIGDEAACASCGRPIRFVGKYWEHIGWTPRHPARPRQPHKEGQR